jgi:hypothetical protein
LLLFIGGAWLYSQFISSVFSQQSRAPVSENRKEAAQAELVGIRALF